MTIRNNSSRLDGTLSPIGENLQSKSLFLIVYGPHLSTVLAFSIAFYPVCFAVFSLRDYLL